MMRRDLTEEEMATKNALDAEVEAALDKRRQWLDKKLIEIATLKVGDSIYDIEKGVRLGVVTEIYNFLVSQDKHSSSLQVDYKYQESGHIYDNTSRQIGRTFGSRQDAIQWAESRLRKLTKP